MKNLKKIKQWALGVSVVTMLGFGWACTDEDAPDNLAPGFSDYAAENVMRTSAHLSASLNGSVNLVKEYGFQYSTSSEFPTDQTKSVKVGDGQPSGRFVADLTGLERNKTYYYRVYASTGATTVYSKYGVFNTPSSSQPALADTKVVEIGENYAKVSFRLVDIGDEHLIECGVGYMKSSNTDNAYTPVVAKLADSVYVAEIFDLDANTNYSFRPYAKNGAKADGSAGVIEGYGDVVQEKTDVQLAPKVKTEDETSSGISSITVSGLIDVDSPVGTDGTIFDCGFVWCSSSESQKPRLELNHSSVSMKVPEELDEHFVGEITGLMSNTTYYVCAYARNEVDGELKVGYGDVISITTGSLMKPNLNIDSYETTASSIILQATITNYDKGALKEKGFIYDRSSEISLEDAEKNGTIIKTLTGTNVFTDTIPGLSMNTSYFVRAYAVYVAEGAEPAVGYSGSYNITTSDYQAPNIGVEANNITRNSVDLLGKMYGQGNGTITERGFVLITTDVTYEPTLKHKGVIKIVSDDTFASTAKNLTKETSYSYRSYVISKLETKVDTVYSGGWNSFQTLGINAPAFNNVSLKNETYNSFEATCGITDIGDGKLLEKGFIFRKNSNDFSENADSVVVESESNDEFTVKISRVFDYDNWYYVSCYTKKDVDGVEIISRSGSSSVYIPAPSSPNFSTLELDSITYNSVNAKATISDAGDGTLLEKGFYWSKEGSVNRDSIAVESTTLEDFSALLSGLDYDNYYHFGVYTKKDINGQIVINQSGWLQSWIWIPGPSGTSFGEVKLDSATYHSFIVTGGITTMGDGTFLEKGFFWKKDGTDFGNGVDSLIVESDNHDEFTAKVTGLESNYWYYVGAYTKMDLDGKIVINRSGWNSTWVSGPTMPSFDNFSLNENVYRTLDVSVEINNSGDGEIIEKGFCWRQVGYENWDSPSLEKNDGSVVFTGGDSIYTTIKDLEVGKEYYVRAYAKVKFANGEHLAYSDTHGRTLSSPNLPSISYWNYDIPDEDRTRNSFKVKSYLESNGNGTITNRGYVVSEWAKNTEPTIEACDFKYDDVDENFEKNITGLKHGTEYAVRAFVVAKWEEELDTVYSERIHNIWTRSVTLPSFKPVSFSNKGLSEMTVTTTITDKGEGTMKEKGFCWHRSTSDFTLDTENVISKAVVTADTLKLTMSNLEANTTYYVRAYAKVEIDSIEYVAYSNVGNNTTSSYSYPSLNTPKSDSEKLTRNSAYLTGVVSSAGNGVITEKGFVLSKASVTYEPTLDSNVAKVVADEDFAASVTGLEWNTEYVARSYVISKWAESNKEEVTYSGYRTFRTEDIVYPKFNNVEVDSITYSSFKVSSGISSLGDGEGALVEKGFIWRNSADDYWREPTVSDCTGILKVDSDSNDSYSLKVDSLLPGQRYGVRAYAKVKIDGKEAIGYSGTNWVHISSLGANVNWTPEAVSCGITVEFTQEAANVKGVYVYLTTDSSETDLSNYTKYTLTQDETTLIFSGTLDNLTENTTYYMKVYYEYAGNMIQYTDTSFSTKRTPQAGDNVSPGKKEE